MIKLTDNERILMSGFNDNKFAQEVSTESTAYQSDFKQEVIDLLDCQERTATGLISSLVRKGVFTSEETAIDDEGHERDRIMKFTDAGVEVVADLRIEDEEAMLELEEDEEDEDEVPEVKTMVSEAAKKAVAKAKDEHTKTTKARQKAAQEDIKEGKPSLRTSHANCDHATQGKEGKIARAKCRRERAAAQKVADEKAAKKAEKAAAKANA